MKKINQYVMPKYVMFMMLTLVVAIGFGFLRQEWLTMFVSLATLLASWYAIHISRDVPFRIPTALITASIVFIYATLFLGEVHNFYERFWWWDVALHTGSAIGFGLVGGIILILMFKQGKVTASPLVISLFTFSFAVAIGAVWEIFEFSMDQFFNMSMQKGGLVDTMSDLIVDSVGAFFAAAASWAYLKHNKPNRLTDILKEGVEGN